MRAGGLQSATRRLLIPAVARMRADHPQVRLEISELELEQALPELRLGALDLVISDEYDGHPRPRPAGLTFEPLHEEPLKLVLPAAHPCAEHGGPVAMTALKEAVWVASATGTGHHALVVGTCRSLGGYEPDLRHRSNDADVQLELVRTTGAVALMPTLALPRRPGPRHPRHRRSSRHPPAHDHHPRQRRGTRPHHLPDHRPRTGAPRRRLTVHLSGPGNASPAMSS